MKASEYKVTENNVTKISEIYGKISPCLLVSLGRTTDSAKK